MSNMNNSNMLSEVKNLKEFIISSNCITYIPLSFSHGMELDAFYLAYTEYLKTGINYIPEFNDIVYLKNHINTFSQNDNSKDLILINKLFNNTTFWNIDYMFTYEQKVKLYKYKESLEAGILPKKTDYTKREIQTKIISDKKLRRVIFKRDGYKCKKCSTTNNLTIDHIIPVSKGGDENIDNLQTLCKSCNSKKGTKDNNNFMVQNG